MRALVLSVGCCALCAAPAHAATNILTPGDPIIPIDRDVVNLTSIYQTVEGPPKAIDNLYLPTSPQTSTKYLNFGRFNTGFTIQPGAGATTLRAFRIDTANDNENRDPATYELYGSNDPALSSPDNSTGSLENWTLISSGALSLPSTRRATGPVVTVANNIQYNLYRMVFPTLKLPTPPMSESIVAVGQEPDKGIDGNPATKYLNFGINNTGFIVTPSRGMTTVTGFQITTANDTPGRDPTSYEIWGTNDAITSGYNSAGTAENWTLISSGAITLPPPVPPATTAPRLTSAPEVDFANSTAYKSYKVIFPTITGPAATTVPPAAGTITSMQVADIQLYGVGTDIPGDFNGSGTVDAADLAIWKSQLGFKESGLNADANRDGIVDGADFLVWQSHVGATPGASTVPEPASAALAMLGLAAIGRTAAFKRRTA
jgi:hypothetical protein